MSASLRQARPWTPPKAAATLHAPLFQEVVGALKPADRHIVLDLGTASTAMLALLGRSRCRVEIADLAHFGGITRLNTAGPGHERASVAESLLPNRISGDAIDLVFCWDLPNYLTLDALSALMDSIGHRARPGTIAHALVFYAERDMPEQPGRFIPATDGELIDHNDARTTVAAPRYSPEDLGKSMRPFTIDRARLLSNGMQEFLFRLES